MSYVTWAANARERIATVYCAHCREVFRTDVPLNEAGLVKQEYVDHVCQDSKGQS